MWVELCECYCTIGGFFSFTGCVGHVIPGFINGCVDNFILPGLGVQHSSSFIGWYSYGLRNDFALYGVWDIKRIELHRLTG
jgi:hypothetical protein